ncbi:hypothetical protein Asppvi_004434 [Aspergillus pseudoviridinutans]|uniref:Zn(2)-C6 fungal-type domain-containing protein n=1 Tax=Aspergillus pseudoviridinutans TaxID=1517512 RepID=A0A9P3BA63_9EURO|nr:uncharacterized protein Asppvi_004434 [Aspergillus pseudoviridinutans]GIJ85575.1 hypothetical protein Asppvi_004434 [Aspergillus pseudoviridinutans]
MPSQPPLSHVGVIVNSSARRVACDQCHAQKLRCTKLENCTVCVRCQRLDRQCIWSPPSRSGRPARTTVVKRGSSRLDTAGGKRHKRSLSALELTAEENGPESAREPVHTSQISTQRAPPAVEISETVPSLPPSVADWNMSDIFSLSSPRYSSRDNPFPPFWTSESVPPIPNFTDYFQMPSIGNQTRTTEDTPAMASTGAPQGLGSLQDITRGLSDINLSLFNLQQSLHAEPWGPMFASPTAVITKLSACGGDQPDDTLAQHFIDIAKQTSIYFASLSTPLTSRTTPTGGAPSRAFCPESDTSSQSSSHLSPVDTYTQPEIPPPASSSTARGDPSSPDLPTALLFTTGYARILDLYTTVSTQISHFVHALSVQSMAGGPDYRQRMHPVIPPLQWGGFQPANYGALQILMAIQVISYLLAGVERALGVDEWEREVTQGRSQSEERVRSPSSYSGGEEGGFNSSGQKHAPSRPEKRAGARRGLLSAAMIEIVVQGEGPRNRRGKVGLLRRKLERVKKELEKSMHS